MPDPSNRQLAAILFTDIVGYTSLMAADEERGLRVREQHRDLVLPLIEQHHGESIELRGDECLSVFPSALNAIRCALDIQDAVENVPDLDLHIGIHVGDVVRVGDEVSGDGVNVARRLCASSVGGGLCVSAEVREAVRNQPDVEAVAFGPRQFKGVGRPVEVFALGRPGRVRPATLPRDAHTQRGPLVFAAAAALILALAGAGWLATHRSPDHRREAIRSIAVLPLENLSGDPEQEYFVNGMTEALIADLARIDTLRVTSRTTVMAYKGTTRPLTELAEELGVDAIIEGSVYRDGERVRVTAQLIDGRRDEHLWADQFDRDLTSVLTIQREIAAAVAQQVEARMTPQVTARFSTPSAAAPEAEDAYMKGMYFAQKHTPRASMRARGHFEESIRIDPEFPLGYAGLADMLSCSPMHTWVVAAEGEEVFPRAVMNLAEKFAVRAVELDADLPEGQTALGLVHAFRWDWDKAMLLLDKAVAINPSYEFARRGRALTLAALGRLEEAKRDIDVALEVDPLNAMVTHTAGDIYQWLGEAERSLALYHESIELDSGNPLGSQSLGLWQCRNGATDAGLALLREASTISLDDPLVVSDVGYCLAISERADEARVLLAELIERSAGEWVSPVSFARIHIGLGEHGAALDALENAYSERAYRLVELGTDDRWDPIRDHPRFRQLVQEVGVRDDWRGSI